MPSIRACVHQQCMQGVQILWPRSAQTGYSCVPRAQAAVKTPTWEKELQQALTGISLMYPLPMVWHLHLSSGVVGLSPCWQSPCPAAWLVPAALELKGLLPPMPHVAEYLTVTYYLLQGQIKQLVVDVFSKLFGYI